MLKRIILATVAMILIETTIEVSKHTLFKGADLPEATLDRLGLLRDGRAAVVKGEIDLPPMTGPV
jgi:hypothetical protein